MSRCFPFPPPGYEKKPRTDDADLLKKEKHKEKKHKKDKKDKDKKESKGKREKDRSDGKNKEKKDRKEKHREKKKDKEKDRDKNTTSEEKRVGGVVDGYNGEKIHPREELDKETKCSSDAIQYIGQQGGKPVQSSSILVRETEDPKFVQELGRRIRDDDKEGAGTSQLFEKFGMVSEGKNKEKKADNNNMGGQRIRDEASFVGITMVENRARMPQNKLEGPTILSDKKAERKIEEKTKSRDRENNDKRGDKRKKKEIDKKSQGKERDGEKEKKKEEKGKEKSEHKKTEKQKTKDSSKNDVVCASNDKFIHLSKDGAETAASEGNLKKRKAVETNGFSHDDELPRPNKMPRPSSTQNGRMLEPSYQSPGLFPLDRQRQVAMASPNNLKIDNKEQKINGTIASPSPPLPLFKPRPSSSPSPSTASHNMKTFPVSLSKPSSSPTANEPSVSTVKPPFATANEIAAPVMSAKPPFASSNETVTSVASISATKQPSGIILASDSATAAAAANKASRKQSASVANKNQVAMKPPHPDSKFLSQILCVPKMEEEVVVSDVDDQEWLFSSKDGVLKKPDSKASVEEEPQVWAEALRLESVDIFALPYVVPY